jgi:hypothetical protein
MPPAKAETACAQQHLCDFAPLVSKKRAPLPADPPHRPRTIPRTGLALRARIYNALGPTIVANFQYNSRRIVEFTIHWPH